AVWETIVAHGFSRMSRFTSSGSVRRYPGVCLMTLSLTDGAPVELATADLLHQDRGPAHAARQPRSVVHPVPVSPTGEGRLPGGAPEPVHGQHLAGLDADLEELRPILPEGPHDLLRQV